MTTGRVDDPVLPVTAQRPRWSPARADATAAVLSGALATVVFLLVRGSLVDDAYITLSYARNLAEHAHWGLTAHRTANSATSPLNVLVLGLATLVVRNPVAGLAVVFALVNAAQGWGLARLARVLRLGPTTVVAGVLLVVFSPLMLASVGMEMTLALALLVWATVAAAEGRPVLFGLVAAALVLTRLDLVVFPLVLLLAAGPLRRRAGLVVGVAAAAVAPWFVFSWFALGALVPDTVVIKTGSAQRWGQWAFGNGPHLFLDAYPWATVLTALPALGGAVALVAWSATRAWRRPRWAGLGPVAALGAGGALHYLAYTLLAPPPFHWYYAPSAGALTLTLAAAAGAAVHRAPDGRARERTAPARRPVPRLAAPAVGCVLLVAGELVFAALQPWPWRQAPITTNWATPAQYLRVGEALRDRVGGQAVRSPGEIGTIAYACRCDVVDVFSDPGSLQPYIDQREREAGPLMRLLLHVDLAHRRHVPAARPTLALSWHRTAPAGPDAWRVDSHWRGPGVLVLGPASP